MRKTAEFHRIHAEGRAHQLRRRVALEAARMISEQGIRDYRMAKRKAAQRIGITDEGHLPRNREIEDALREHQRLFRADEQPRAQQFRLETARDAMRFLARFEPRLVGPVLEGTADIHSPVTLHLFDDVPEAVAGMLTDHGVAFETRARSVRLDRSRSGEFPVLRFDAGGVAVDVTIFPRDALRQAPLDRIDERPVQRASLAVVDAMLADETGIGNRESGIAR
ncbi:MAG: hypothetical protein ACREP2_09280 [Rhodanobacteraceae bacterium]